MHLIIVAATIAAWRITYKPGVVKAFLVTIDGYYVKQKDQKTQVSVILYWI
jgi:hypothetical protein